MNNDHRSDEGKAKWREDSFLANALCVLGAVLIPQLLHRAVQLPLSWGYVFGFAVASTLGYFFLAAPKKNAGRYVLIILGGCVFGYLVGRFLG